MLFSTQFNEARTRECHRLRRQGQTARLRSFSLPSARETIVSTVDLGILDILPRNSHSASLVLQVDQTERRWEVRLPDGISAASKRVAARVFQFSETFPVRRMRFSAHRVTMPDTRHVDAGAFATSSPGSKKFCCERFSGPQCQPAETSTPSAGLPLRPARWKAFDARKPVEPAAGEVADAPVRP